MTNVMMRVEEGKLSEITSQVEYNDSVCDELTLIERLVDGSPPANNNPPLQPPMAVKIPKLECKIFDGTSEDKLEFKNFLTQFSNCIDACGTLSDANKLTYLRSYLSGYALKVISHLSVTDDNYDIAFSPLKEEFLDVPYIVDESFKTSLSSSPSFDTAFDGLRTYANECRAIIHDLKQYNIDLKEEDTAGCKLLSHIIFSKLSTSVKKELVHKVDDNYPFLNHIFDNYREINKTLVRVSQPGCLVLSRMTVSAIKVLHMDLPRSFLSCRLLPRIVLPIIHLPQLWRISIPLRLMLNLNPALKGLLILKNLVSTVSCAQVLTSMS